MCERVYGVSVALWLWWQSYVSSEYEHLTDLVEKFKFLISFMEILLVNV